MTAHAYAMEVMTQVTASLIDHGLKDYMIETAMLKVFANEALWEIVNDTFQIHDGSAYFTDRPLERMLRDARINQIGEGANDVLRSFIALVGMRGSGERLRRSPGVAPPPVGCTADIDALWPAPRQDAGLAPRGAGAKHGATPVGGPFGGADPPI